MSGDRDGAAAAQEFGRAVVEKVGLMQVGAANRGDKPFPFVLVGDRRAERFALEGQSFGRTGRPDATDQVGGFLAEEQHAGPPGFRPVHDYLALFKVESCPGAGEDFRLPGAGVV